MMRLDKYLAELTGMTRSESRKAITKGRVMVAGRVCRKADTQLDETAAQIALDGAPLAGEYKKYVYIMLNKPEGVVSASRDKRDTTVVDLVAAESVERSELLHSADTVKSIFTSTWFLVIAGIILFLLLVYFILALIYNRKKKNLRKVKKYRRM